MNIALADVAEAKAALAATGVVPSANKIVQRLGRGSKTTVLRLMRQLAQAAPAPEPQGRLPGVRACLGAHGHARARPGGTGRGGPGRGA